MGYRLIKQCVVVLLIGLSVTGTRLIHAYPVEFTLSQVDVYLPQIRIYASLLDENGTPIPTPSEEDVSIKLDGQTLPVKGIKSFRDTGEGVAYTLLLDVSKTMTGSPFDNAVSATKGLIRNMTEKDRIAIITFGDNVKIISDFTNDKNLLVSKLSRVKPDHDNTHFYAAVDKSFALNMRRDPNLPVRRAILVITDGKDEGSGITLDDLLPESEKNGIPIYSIGYTRIGDDFLGNLKRLSELSGGRYLKSREARNFSDIYQKTFGDIQSQFLIRTEYPSREADGNMHQFFVSYSKDSFSIAAEKKVSFIFSEPEPPEPVASQTPDTPELPESPDNKLWIYIILGVAGLLLLSILIFLLVRPKEEEQTRTESEQEIDYEPEFDTLGVTGGDIHDTAPIPDVKKELEPGVPKVQFIVIKGKQIGKTYDVSVGNAGATVGRKGADIVLDDKEISKIHCSVFCINKRFMIQDDGSKNGTFINGIPLKTKSVIEDGDTISIGQCTLRMKVIDMS
ncbi:MAG: VWA domain-containing protein [Desulfobacterales bacterium]|nr:VWA domain-containing protein [Desulfobacterales bacterium]